MYKLENLLLDLKDNNKEKLKEFSGLKLNEIINSTEINNYLTDNEIETLKQCSLSEFYTPADVVDMIYEQLTINNITSGNILEPSCGIGNMIRDNTNFNYTGVELSPISSKIAKLLHPEADIHNCNFKDFKPCKKFDIIIGNVPFVSTVIYDPDYKNLNLKVHEYFVYKCIDLLVDKGVLLLIVPTSLLNSEVILNKITNECCFKRVINLHNETFKNTDICTSIICMQKTNNLDALELNTRQNLLRDISINLGMETTKKDRFGKWVKTLDPLPEIIPTHLSYRVEQIEKAKKAVKTPWYKLEAMPDKTQNIVANTNEAIIQTPQTQDLEKLYYALSECIMSKDNTKLNKEYETFTLRYGQLHNKQNMQKFVNNNKFYAVLSLEKTKATNDPKVVIYEKSNILTKDIFREQTPVNLKNCDFDTAKNLSYNNKGYFDVEYMSELMCTSIAELTTKYNLRIDPITQKIVPSEEYYAGNVRAKINTIKITQLNKITQTLDDILSNSDDPDYFYYMKEKNAKEIINAIAYKHNLVTSHMLEDLDYIKLITDKEQLNYLMSIINNTCNDTFESTKVLDTIFKNIQPVIDNDIKEQIMDLESTIQSISINDLRITPASYWIPMFIFERFINEVLNIWVNTNTGAPVLKRTETNEILAIKTTTSSPKDNEFGCLTHTAFGVLVKLMSNSPLKVYKKDINDKSVLDEEGTVLLEQRAEKLKEAFAEFVTTNYADYLETLYREKFMTHKIKNVTGDYLLLENTNKNINLDKHQKDAIAKIIHNKNTLLGHCVGAGKTYTMIAGIMELKRLGIINKALFVVPNNLIPATVESFHNLYPTANVCFANEKSFEPGNRKAFINNIAMNMYDAIIIGHSQFIKIGIGEDLIDKEVHTEISKINDMINATKYSDGITDSAKQSKIRALNKKKIQIQSQIEKLVDVNKDLDCLPFENLGIDCLVVDEAHIYKNLYTTTSLSNVAGVSTTNSKQAFDMYLKTKHINSLHNGKIIFATGTPISNSVNELYTIQRYLEPWELEDKNIQSFDDWISIFGKVENVIELDPTATTFRQKNRIVKYYSLPELITSLSQIADIKNESDLNLPTPKETVMLVEIEPSDEQKEAIQELAQRVDLIKARAVDPTEDNMLNVTNDGKKIALDLRLYRNNEKDYASSKVNYLVSNVLNVYKSFHDKTQLIFCDMSTPKQGIFNVYDDIKEKLMLYGIPESEIKYIHDAKTKQEEENLHNLVRQGKVKILIGSTSKLGTGVNVQDKLIAIHDLDIPWRPSDLEQRAGRIKRRGNNNNQVLIYRYITAKTFDAYLWQTLENKQRFISTIMNNKDIDRIVDNDDTTTLNFAEAKALAIGDSRIKDYVELQNEGKKLEIQLQGMYKILANNKVQIKFKLEQMISLQKYYNSMLDDVNYLKSLGQDTINLIANNIPPNNANTEELDRTIKETIKNRAMDIYSRQEVLLFDDFYGFKVYVRASSMDSTKTLKEVVLKRTATYSMSISMQESIVERIFRLIKGITEKLQKTYDDYMGKYEFVEKMIGKEELEKCLANEQIEVNITNSEEINEMKHKLADINNKLQELKVELNV